ncbi:MAG: hypothetical protein AB7O57_09510 [Hyphomicrobiaceae bacterium]
MSTIDELERMIGDYRVLSLKHQQQMSAGATSNAHHIAVALHDLCLTIARTPSDEPAITRLQIEFIVSLLATGGLDESTRTALGAAVLSHVDRLAARSAPRHVRIDSAAGHRRQESPFQ